MLRSIIDPADTTTGQDQPIPAALRVKVERAAEILKETLHDVGEKFDIVIHWRFSKGSDGDYTVILSMTTSDGGVLSHPVPKAALENDDSIRRHLWSPLWALGNVLSNEVKRDLERIRQRLQAIDFDTEEV